MNAANVPNTRWGRAATIDQERRRAPETGLLVEPPPSVGIPAMIAAPSPKVTASAIKSMFVEVGKKPRIPLAIPKPTAPASIDVAATIAFALPTCPAGTRFGIAACLAG